MYCAVLADIYVSSQYPRGHSVIRGRGTAGLAPAPRGDRKGAPLHFEKIRIYVPGESDGVFDPTDTVLFYGLAIKNDKYTGKNIYWLTTGGSNGQRMSPRDGTLSGGATVPGHFLATLHAEENTEYWLHMFNGEDHFFWGSRLTVPASATASVTHSLTITNISTSISVSAAVRVRLQGYTDTDHHTKIYLNNDHRPLLTEFYEIIFQDKQYNLGAATTAAKIAIAGTPSRDELIDTFVLFGDPAMKIGVPAGAPGDNSTYLPIIIK